MKKVRIALGFLLSAFFLYLFLRSINLREVWRVIGEGNPLWLLLCLVMNLLNYFVRALRWRYFFKPIKEKIGLWNAFSTTVIGFSLSALFPARVGEVVRPYLLGSRENIGRSAALATVVVERLFDTLTVLFMLVVYLLFLLHPDQLNPEARSWIEKLKTGGLIMFAGVLGLVAFLYFLRKKPGVKLFVRKLERVLPTKMANALEGILDSFIEGLAILDHPKLLLQITVWSIGFWLVIATTFWACARAYTDNFAFPSTFLIMIILAVGIAIPTPGGVGSYHFACKIGLTRFFEVTDTQAGAIALVSHFINFVPITILGLILLWQGGLTPDKITEIAKEAEKPTGSQM